MFVNIHHFYRIQIFADKRCSLPFPLGLAPSQAEIFRLAGEWLTLSNALAYNNTIIVAPVKQFYGKKRKIEQSPVS